METILSNKSHVHAKGLSISVATVLFATTALGAENNPNNLRWSMMVMGLLGGLAIFLLGMEQMSNGMKKIAGSKMHSLIASLTNNRVVGFIVGGLVTTVIQSSTATTVMLVGFVQAGLMSFTQSLGVILGADIGSTTTAQLVALKLNDYALWILTVGFAFYVTSKNERVIQIGETIIGFGLLFFGMKIMSDSMEPLKTYPQFLEVLKNLENPILGLLVGAVFTALIHSSGAFSAIVVVMASEGLVSLDAGIPLIMGANIGTCITAVMASFIASREAKRVALAHTLFKFLGVFLFIFWIPSFIELVKYLSIENAGPGRLIANAHTVFNVSFALAFLPFTPLFANLINRILPDKAEEAALIPKAWHLDYGFVDSPLIAIDLARAEVSRMTKIVRRMVHSSMTPFVQTGPLHDQIYPKLTLVEGIIMREKKVDYLDETISDYLLKISHEGMSSLHATQVFGFMSIVNDLESIGDLVMRDILPQMSKKKMLQVDFSQEGKEELIIYHRKVCKQLNRIQRVMGQTDRKKALRILSRMKDYSHIEAKFRLKHLERMQKHLPETLKTHELHMELMDLMKQISVYTTNITKTLHNMWDSEVPEMMEQESSDNGKNH